MPVQTDTPERADEWCDENKYGGAPVQQHTPGPWVAHDKGGRGWRVDGPMPSPLPVIFGTGRRPEAEANARLAAAAPELLKLARRVADLNRNAGEIGEGMLVQLVDEARRAVLKATGR